MKNASVGIGIIRIPFAKQLLDIRSPHSAEFRFENAFGDLEQRIVTTRFAPPLYSGIVLGIHHQLVEFFGCKRGLGWVGLGWVRFRSLVSAI
jgi:hypothetical protein